MVGKSLEKSKIVMLNHVEIWHNCRLDEYLLLFKDLGHPREFKNGTIMLKFSTLVNWMNTRLGMLGMFFFLFFFKSSFLGLFLLKL